jgi:ribosomal protein S18
MGVNQADYKNHEVINTFMMTIKKRICCKDRLTGVTQMPQKIIENIIHNKKYIERRTEKITK